MSAELQLLGSGYQGRSPYGLRVQVLEEGVAIAIHRPATAERATALILLSSASADELERFLREDR